MKLPNNVDYDYFQALTNLIINNIFTMHESKIYLQTSDIPQGGSSSSMIMELFLYNYECNYKCTNLQLYRY